MPLSAQARPREARQVATEQVGLYPPPPLKKKKKKKKLHPLIEGAAETSDSKNLTNMSRARSWVFIMRESHDIHCCYHCGIFAKMKNPVNATYQGK